MREAGGRFYGVAESRDSIRLGPFEGDMRNLKLIFSAAVAIGAIGIGAASAADLAARPYTKAAPMMVAAYDWSGFYIGGNGGYGSSHKCWNTTGLNGGGGIQPFAFADGCHDATGGIGGGQIGYRWQSGTWVFGLEAQGDWADLRGSNHSNIFGGAGATNASKINGLGLFTGQVGYAWNNALLYIKGGAAVTSDRYQGIVAGGALIGQTFDTANETRWGGTVGVGLEYGFAPNWSVALEYDHLFMGTHNNTFTIVLPGPTVGLPSRAIDIGQDADMITARINYRFGGPVVTRY
jgi:outer membrane immunogenic protein